MINNYSKIRKLFVEEIMKACFGEEAEPSKDEMIDITKKLIFIGDKLGIKPSEELENFADNKVEESVLAEGKIWDKVKEYAKKVLFSAALLGSMIGFANSAQAGFTTDNGWTFYGSSKEGMRCKYAVDLSEDEVKKCSTQDHNISEILSSAVLPEYQIMGMGEITISKLVNYDNVSIQISSEEDGIGIENATVEEGYKFLIEHIFDLAKNLTLDQFKKIFEAAKNSEEAKKAEDALRNGLSGTVDLGDDKVKWDDSEYMDLFKQGYQFRAFKDAVEDKHWGPSKYPCEAVSWLVEQGIKPTTTDPLNGDSLIIHAIRSMKDQADLKDVIEQLLKAGVDINAKNSAGNTALQIAENPENKSSDEIIAFLKANGAK